MIQDMISKNNTYCHKFLTVLHRLTHTLPILFEYAWSMATVWVEYGYSMGRVWNNLMIRYNQQMGTRKFPYENLQLGVANLVVSLREPLARHSQTGGFFTRNLLFVVMMLMGVNAWGQTLPFEVTTADDKTNHTEKFYWIESAGAIGFYAVPHSNGQNASTTNAPTLRALWYFMESDESGYYYIINKETGKYLKKTGKAGDDNTIEVANYDADNDVKFKFSFGTPAGVAEGNWVIYPKDNSDNNKTGWLSKKSGNLKYGDWLKSSTWNNTPVGDLNSQWKIMARDAVQWPRSGLPFVVSTSSEKHYYRINHAQSTDYNISYDGSNYVTISTERDNKTAWYFEEAATDPKIDNLKYYYIVNASSGKYLKFTATTIDGSNQNDKFTLSEYNSQDEDRFQFVVVNSYGGNAGYSIMPKLAMSKYDVSKYANSMVSASVANNEKLDLRSDRNNSNAHWNFVTTEYPMKCTISSITYDSSTGKITIKSSPSYVDIHYTLDGTAPTSSVGTLYSEPFDVSGPIKIKAIATADGYYDSDVVTKSFSQVATPSIQNTESTVISITTATNDATIYYTTDGSTPTTSSTPPYIEPVTITASSVTIKAIAVKDGMINSDESSESFAFSSATPIITYDNTTGEVTITSTTEGANIYYTLDGTTKPTSSSTPYEGPFEIEDLATIKAIAIKTGILDSEIASAKLILNATVTLAGNEYTYDGLAQKPDVSSVMDGENPINAEEYAVSYDNNTNAGNEAVVTITDKEGGDYIVYGSATFTIHPKELTITAEAKSKSYGDDDPVLTYTSEGLVGSDAITGSLSRDAGENVGTYAINQNTLTASSNYTISYTEANLTITRKTLTVTAKPKTITYGDVPANDGVTYSGFVGEEGESDLGGTLTYAYNYAQYDNAGDYTITPSGLTGENYDISFIAGTLTVGQKEVGLTWDETTSFPYDGSAHAPTATATGMVNSDAIVVVVTGAQTNAGDYTATASSLTGDKAGNYKLPDDNTQVFSITKVGLTVTANNNTITYGDAPAGDGVTYEGFVNSETESVLGGTLGYNYSYAQYGDVGDYTIKPKGLTSNNYDISFVAGTLTVGQKKVGLTWGETTSFSYDGEAHAPTATATGMENSDAIAVVVTGAQTNAGDYTATASLLTGDKAGNYKLPDANTQSFTISRKSIGNGMLADGYTLDFGEGNTILLMDDHIGSTLAISTDYSVGDDTDPSDKYSKRRVTGQNNYTGYFDVRNVVISFTTDTDQEEWSATFVAEKADESDIGLALPEGISAFIIFDIRGERVIPEPLNYIPEGVPVLLVAHRQINGFVATKAESGDVTPTPITDVQKEKNMLKEVKVDTPNYDPGSESVHFETKQIYVLYKNEFVFNKAGNMKKGKVYLINPNYTVVSPVPAPARLQIAWNYTTGIQHPQNGNIVKTQDDVWYTIDGRRLSGKPNAKGLYIVGGKKIVIK